MNKNKLLSNKKRKEILDFLYVKGWDDLNAEEKLCEVVRLYKLVEKYDSTILVLESEIEHLEEEAYGNSGC